MQLERIVGGAIDGGRRFLREQGRLTEHVVPKISLSDVVLCKRIESTGDTTGHAHTEVYEASVTGTSRERIQTAFPELSGRFAVKIVDLEKITRKKETRIKESARPVWLSDDRHYRENTALGPTVGYCVEGGKIYFLMEGVDTDLGKFLRDTNLQPRDILESIMPLWRGLADYHRHGGVHRDIKPANIGLNLDGERIAAARMLDWDLGRNRHFDEGITEDLTRDGLRGTRKYLSPRLLSDPETMLDDPSRDTYALGVLLTEMLTDLPDSYDEIRKRLSDLLRSGELTRICRERSLQGLDRIIARALQDGYEDAGKMTEHLSHVLEGRPWHVRLANRTYWKTRGGERHRTRHRIKKRARNLAMCGTVLLATAGTAAWDALHLYLYNTEYEQSPQALARELSASDFGQPQRDAYLDSLVRSLMEDEREHFGPRRAAESMIVPMGAWTANDGALSYTNTTTLSYGGFMNMLLSLYSMTGDPDVRSLIKTYVSELRIEKSGDSPDYKMTAVARAEPLLAFSGTLDDVAARLEGDEKERFEKGRRNAQTLAIYGAVQHHVKSRDSDVNVRHDYRLAALCRQLALQPELLNEPLDDNERHRLSEQWRIPEERIGDILGIDDLIESMRFASAEVSSLLRDDGKSFGKKTRGSRTSYRMLVRDVTHDGTPVPEDEAEVLVQDAARLYAAQSYRLHVFETVRDALLEQGTYPGLRDPAAAAHNIGKGMEHAMRTITILDRQFDEYTDGWQHLPPPVVYSTPDSRNIRYTELESDARATAIYLHGLVVQGREEGYRPIMRMVWGNERMRTPDRPAVVLWPVVKSLVPEPFESRAGTPFEALDFPDSTLGYENHDGPGVRPTGLMLRSFSEAFE